MKVKHRNYWSFFWRVGAGFLAFWVAAMGVATGLAAQRYRDSVRDVVQGYVQDVETTAHEAEQAAPRDAQEMLYSACNEWLQPAVSMAAVFDRERNLAAHTGNYLAGRGCYLDMDRWLTDEEQEALVTVYQQNTGFGYQAENEGKEYYGLSVDGWLDGVMLIPERIAVYAVTVERVPDSAMEQWDAVEQAAEKAVLMARTPQADTTGLERVDADRTLFRPTDSSLAFTLPGFETGEDAAAYFRARDAAGLAQGLEQLSALAAEALYVDDAARGEWFGLSALLHLDVVEGCYLNEPVSGANDAAYVLLYRVDDSPVREAAGGLIPVYLTALLLVLALTALLAFSLLRVWRRQERVEQARRDTTAALAHELKTPLSVLSATAELLSSDMAQDKRAHYLEVIRQQAARLDGSVRHMLELSRLEAGAKALRRAKFALSDLAQERLDAAVPPDAGLHTEVTADGADEIDADRALLARALDAILENAVQHTAPGGGIAVRIGKGVCAVVNTGAPIPPDALPRLWEAYYQADASRAAEGDGLGLSIAKTVFDLHGYAYGAENTDEGPRFWFRFGKA